MPIFKLLSIVLVLLLCSCSAKDSSNEAPDINEQSREKSKADTSLTEHKKEIQQMNKESIKKEPTSRYSDHIMTNPPTAENEKQGKKTDPTKRRGSK